MHDACYYAVQFIDISLFKQVDEKDSVSYYINHIIYYFMILPGVHTKMIRLYNVISLEIYAWMSPNSLL